MRRPERRLLHVYHRALNRSIKAGSRIRFRNSCEVILHLVVLLHMKHSRHFLHRYFSDFPLRGSRCLCWYRDTVSSHFLYRFSGEFHSARVVYSSIGCSHSESGAFLLATSRPAVSINLRTVCSTTGSPRVSLGSGIVTRPVLAGSQVSVV